MQKDNIKVLTRSTVDQPMETNCYH